MARAMPTGFGAFGVYNFPVLRCKRLANFRGNFRKLRIENTTLFLGQVGPCEALPAPLPSTDTLDTLLTHRVASQRRVPTAKALENCLPSRFSSVASRLFELFSAVAGPAAAFPRLHSAPKRRDFADFAELASPMSHDLARFRRRRRRRFA